MFVKNCLRLRFFVVIYSCIKYLFGGNEMKKLLLLAFMVLFALPAFAFNIYNTPEGDKVDIYGSIRMAAGYQNSQGFTAGKFATKTSDLTYAMFGTSRLGIDFKIDKFFGTAEFNFNMDGGSTALGFRQLFAGYDFGKGHKLVFGQKTVVSGTSAAFADFWFADNSFAGFGVLSAVRRPTLLYSYYGLDIALVVNTDVVGKVFDSTPGTPNDAANDFKPGENYIPRFEIGYNFSSGANFKGKIAATYGLFTEKNAAGTYKNIDAYHVVALFQPKFGKGYLNITAFYGSNTAMYSMGKSLNMTSKGAIDTADIMPKITADGKIQNVQSWGAALEAGYNFTDVISGIIGVGGQMNISDRYKTADLENHNLNSYGVYGQMPIKLNKYMKIIPSVGYYNSGLDNTNEASKNSAGTLLAGAEFKVDF